MPSCGCKFWMKYAIYDTWLSSLTLVMAGGTECFTVYKVVLIMPSCGCKFWMKYAIYDTWLSSLTLVMAGDRMLYSL